MARTRRPIWGRRETGRSSGGTSITSRTRSAHDAFASIRNRSSPKPLVSCLNDTTDPALAHSVDTTEPNERPLWRRLGPGLVTGASDDDPSGIATYSQVGARFGYALGWTMLFSFPLMSAGPEISARIGSVTGYGLAGRRPRHYSVWPLRAAVGLLLIAHVLNLGGDLGAMGSALKLMIGGSTHLYAVLFGAM